MRQRRGCVGGIIGCGAILAFLVCAAFGAGSIFYFLRSSDVYQMAMAEAQQHPGVVARLGEPIEDGWLMSGSIETSNGDGSADFSIPLSGPNGSGTLAVEATRSNGVWEFTQLDLQTESETISLLGSGR